MILLISVEIGIWILIWVSSLVRLVLFISWFRFSLVSSLESSVLSSLVMMKLSRMIIRVLSRLGMKFVSLFYRVFIVVSKFWV